MCLRPSPTERYIRYLDPLQSGTVLAEGVREAYADLFRINTKAQGMSRPELKGKLKVLAQGKLSDAVADKMATTFTALAKAADWTTQVPPPPNLGEPDSSGDDDGDGDMSLPDGSRDGEVQLGGLVYNIQIQLPESRDQAVYDALFKSLRAHLLK